MGEERFYNPKFYRELDATRDSARIILPMIIDLMKIDLLKPASIIDVGCGAGHWLAVAGELGLQDILGIDGEWALKTQLAIPREKFVEHDLRTPLMLGRKFDVALSLEVAEHLPESCAQAFVETLCGLADRVIFSAAIPGQGGRHHVNEQWPGYWAELFEKRGYDCHDILRPRIWNNPQVMWYYAQNCLIFGRRGVLAHLGTAAPPLSLVHPRLWTEHVAAIQSPGKLLERLPKAILKRLNHGFRRNCK
jgi:SAM-dependent methyltransferase